MGELIDELSIANIKMHYWNHQKIEERKKPNPDLKLIDEIDRQIMATNERRAKLKNALNMRFGDITEERTYKL